MTFSRSALASARRSRYDDHSLTLPADEKEYAMPRQSTSHLLLIEPATFYANPETMDTNIYQIDQSETHEQTYQKALAEFRAFRDVLVENGVVVTTLKGSTECPDHLFPNWISTHENREMVVYPMLNDNRRAERTDEIIKFFETHYDIALDISAFEERGQFLESTGSLNMDRINKVVYAGLSGRTDETLAKYWAEQMGYELETFRTETDAGKPVYHTDLVMYIGSELAVICADCIVEEDRQRVLDRLSKTHKVVELSMEQLNSFCGNSLEILNTDGERMLVMSKAAFDALREDQLEIFNQYFTKILYSDISTIEKYGGGSARCLIMEMF